MAPGTDKLLSKAARALQAAEAGLEVGAADIAAGRAFYAMLYAAKARLNERGLRLRSHARIAAALAESEGAPAPWLSDALQLRARLAADPDGVTYTDATRLVERARVVVDATQRACA